MLKIAVVLMNLFSSAAFATPALAEAQERCGSLADRKLKSVVQAVDFPVEYIQWGHVDRIERMGFDNFTPGTFNQEYLGTYRLTYKASPYALFQEQVVEVQFASPFACDDLKLRCMNVVSSKLVEKVDPSIILKSGPLSCQAQ